MKKKNSVAIIAIALIAVIATIFANCSKNQDSDKTDRNSATQYGQTEITDTPFEKITDSDDGTENSSNHSKKDTSAKPQNSTKRNSDITKQSSNSTEKVSEIETSAGNTKKKTDETTSNNNSDVTQNTTETTTVSHTDLPFVPAK